MRLIVAFVVSVVVPGYGSAAAGRLAAGIAIAVAAAACHLACGVTPWALLALLAVRIASGVHAAIARRRRGAFDWFAAPALAVGVASVCAGGLLRLGVTDPFRVPSSGMAPTLLPGDHIFVERLRLLVRGPERGDPVVFHYPCAERDYIKRVVAVGGDTVEVRCGVVYVNGAAAPQSLVAAHDEYDDLDEYHSTWEPTKVARYRETLGGHDYELFFNEGRDPQQPGLRDFPAANAELPSCASSIDGGAQGEPLGAFVDAKPAAAGDCAPHRAYRVPAGYFFALGDDRDNSNDSRVFGPVANDAAFGLASGIWLSSGAHGVTLSRVGHVP